MGHQETLTKKDFATVIGINPLCERQGANPDRGQSPLEWGEIPHIASVHPSTHV